MTLDNKNKSSVSPSTPGTPRGPQGGHRGGEKPKNAKKTLNRIFQTMSDYKIHLVVVLFLGSITSLCSVYGTYLLRPIINDHIVPLVGQESPDFSGLAGMLIKMASVYIIGAFSNYLASRIMITVSSGTLRKIRVGMFKHIQNLPIKYFDSKTHGEIMSHFTNDADTMREMISNSIPNLVSSLITITGVMVAMITMSWQLFLLVIFQLVVIFVVLKVIGGKSSNYFKKQQRALGDLNGYIEEMIEGQRVVKVFHHEEEVKSIFNGKTEGLFSVASRASMYSLIIMPILGSFSYIHYALTASIGTVMVIRGILDVGTIGAFLQYTRTFTQPINQMSQQITSILSALAGAERIFKLMDEPVESDDGKIVLVNVEADHNGQFVESSVPTGHWAWKLASEDGKVQYRELKGDMRFTDVTFAYEPGKPVLKDISLYAKPGQKIAFVGSTGAGKTTLTNLINRFYDVSEGTITYDGIDINEIKKDDLRGSLSMVLQDTHLFTGTVMENIRYGKLDATDEEVIYAAKLANADFFITHLPQGYQTVLVGDGANLSQGQRQLLAIARAAVKDPPILILDEATSSIDTRTEALIEKGMDKLMEGRTVFVIAHRLSTVRNSNAILVLENGEIIERGDHETLLEQKGRYYQLYTGMFDLS